MRIHTIAKSSIYALAVALISSTAITAQQADLNKKIDTATMVLPAKSMQREMTVVGDSELYCAGFVQSSPMSTSTEIVGAENEKDQHVYFQGDYLYINAGSANGVNEGDMYSVVRPRGDVNTDWTNKNDLGFFVQEVGAVEVHRVMSDVSVVKVKTSCSSLLLGDLLQPIPSRKSPMFEYRGAFDRFSSPSGKASGWIFMARDNAEVLGVNQIVYVDLGAEDGVSVGDVLTVFRPLGTGNVFPDVKKETLDNKEDGYESNRYEGGHFSNQAARKKGSEGNGAVVTTENAKSRRPSTLRRVVGEVMILNVKERTSTAIVLRNSSEIHTGDRVEVK
ncbi:MAG: hypothetical protein DWQ47_16995 [Acidobacteria bacterium]|nr:MAG: hypothetical protein DWQ32_04395 [Acidobacteriota bacterium]REK02260.1 MAG: hypothetical protein DWQ38_07755 [Acidobacteriota bacterium]REK13937.1 MAG: hypothetical protein DWQ43_10085 [Acidobacteriota bacterium]REK41931.1 MAG: hypothetical protein DWQ47_16995 [Acidobacteriota bacterium]